MAARFVAARSTVRAAFGDRYPFAIAPIVTMLRKLAASIGPNASILDAALTAMRGQPLNSTDRLWILAAVADASDEDAKRKPA